MSFLSLSRTSKVLPGHTILSYGSARYSISVTLTAFRRLLNIPALLCLSLLVLLLVTACNEEVGQATPTVTASPTLTPSASPTNTPIVTATPTSTGSPAPTSSPSPTPGAGLSGIEGFRRFAAEVQTALNRRDVDFFIDRALLTRHECTAADVSARVLPCERTGQVIEGIIVGRWRSEGTLADLADYRDLLVGYLGAIRPDTSDSFGTGNALVYAVGEGRPQDGTPTFLAITTAIVNRGQDTARTVHVFGFVFADGRWQLQSDLQADVLYEQLLSEQCTAEGPCVTWERWHP